MGGTRSGWKSSQGGTSIRTAVPEGAQDDTLPEGWNLETGWDDGVSLVENPVTGETVPEGWKGSEDNHTSYIKPELLGEEGVNTPTASLRNIIIDEDEHKDDGTMPGGWKVEDEVAQEAEVTFKEHMVGEEGVNTPTASLRNIIITEDEPGDETVPEGWKIEDEATQETEVISEEHILGEEGVNTPTASLRNILCEPNLEEGSLPVGWKDDDRTSPPKPQPHGVPEAFARIGLVPFRESQQPATVVGTWGHEGNARIGPFPNEVGPKKPKTRTGHPSSSLVCPTMGGGEWLAQPM